MVEISFMVIGLTQLICYFNETIKGKGKVAVALTIGVPLLALREVVAGGYLLPEIANAVIVAARVVGDGLAIPGIVGFVKDNFSAAK